MTYLSFDLSFIEALECNASAFFSSFSNAFLRPSLCVFPINNILSNNFGIFLSLSFVFYFDLLSQEADRAFYRFCTVVEFVSGVALSCFRSILYTLYCILFLVCVLIRLCVCVCVCVFFIKLHITAKSGPVILRLIIVMLCFYTILYYITRALALILPRGDQRCVLRKPVCVCVCVFIKCTYAQSGPVALVILRMPLALVLPFPLVARVVYYSR